MPFDPSLVPCQLKPVQRHAQHLDANVCMRADCDRVAVVSDLAGDRADVAKDCMVHGVDICLDVLLSHCGSCQKECGDGAKQTTHDYTSREVRPAAMRCSRPRTVSMRRKVWTRKSGNACCMVTTKAMVAAALTTKMLRGVRPATS